MREATFQCIPYINSKSHAYGIEYGSDLRALNQSRTYSSPAIQKFLSTIDDNLQKTLIANKLLKALCRFATQEMRQPNSPSFFQARNQTSYIEKSSDNVIEHFEEQLEIQANKLIELCETEHKNSPLVSNFKLSIT